LAVSSSKEDFSLLLLFSEIFNDAMPSVSRRRLVLLLLLRLFSLRMPVLLRRNRFGEVLDALLIGKPNLFLCAMDDDEEPLLSDFFDGNRDDSFI
jgi:hypothetical protein